VIVEKYYGYDVSAPLIEIANEKYANEPNLKFFKINLDTEFKDVEEFDVVVSFFVLHWVNDIKTVG
jgi:2-polyprenyl-3-methyl-5-hydroxy-6-metoxy-1,4-benzoquinol methylase